MSKINKTIVLIVFLIVFSIYLASLAIHVEINFDNYSEMLVMMHAVPIITILASGLLLITIYFFFAVLNIALDRLCKLSGRISNSYDIIIALSVALTAIMGLAWIHFNPYQPVADQEYVWTIATQVAQGDSASINTQYLDIYPQQKGMILVMAAVIRLTPFNALTTWKVLSVLMSCLIVFGLSILANTLFKDKKVGAMTSLLTMLFVPHIIYTSFIYGTLWAIACNIWLFYFFYKFIERLDVCITKASCIYVLVTLILLFMSITVYKSALISGVAMVVTLLIKIAYMKKNIKNITSSMIILLLLIFVITQTSNIYTGVFAKKTHITTRDGLPSIVWVVMGLTYDQEANGPGAYTTKTGLVTYYSEGASQEEVTNRAIEILKDSWDSVEQYGVVRFFAEKLTYQWLDPWFNSLTMNCYLGDDNIVVPEHVKEILLGNYARVLQALLYIFISLMYGMIALGLILVYKKEKYSHLLFVILIYFFGGFIFQLFWESKARYCLPYYLILIPIAAYSFVYYYEKIRDFVMSKEKKFEEI